MKIEKEIDMDELFEMTEEITEYIHKKVGVLVRKTQDPYAIATIIMSMLVGVTSSHIINMDICINHMLNKPFPLPQETIDRIIPPFIDSLKISLLANSQDRIKEGYFTH